MGIRLRFRKDEAVSATPQHFVSLQTGKPEHTTPYFPTIHTLLVSRVEATQVSHDVSARIAEQAAKIPPQKVGRLGAIESELLGAIPRATRATRLQSRIWMWGAGILAAFATLVALSLQMGIHFAPLLKYQFVFQIVLQCFLLPMIRKSGNRTLLRNGIPARALITAEEDLASSEQTHTPKRTISFVYQFERDGLLQNGSFTMQRKRAWQLSIAEGSTFTVLCDSSKASVHVPYFQITDAEIVGAMGAKVTPP